VLQVIEKVIFMQTKPKIEIRINGETRQISPNLTIRQLLELLALPPGRVAVEQNRKIVKSADWDDRTVNPDDELEVVHFVGGG
jgi:thiamine biosynthesis protein ThiS